MCVENTAAGTDAEVELNQQLALRMFWAKRDEEKPVSRLVIVHEDGAGDTKVGRCAAGGPIRLGDKTYTRGIGVNSHSVIRVTLAKPAMKFLAMIGLDRNVDNTVASVRFQLIGLIASPPGSRTGFVPTIVGASVLYDTMTPVSVAFSANFKFVF